MDLQAIYPSVWEVLRGTTFPADWASAASVAKAQGNRALYDLTKRRGLKSNLLTHFLGSSVFSSYRETAAAALALEQDLRSLIRAVGADEVRRSYRDKLVLDPQFEDTRYEIAVAAALAGFFDSGSLRLEVPLPGSRKNSDVAGQRAGQAYRVEVKVVHEDWPPVVSDEVQRDLESVGIPAGYSVLLRRSVRYANEVAEVVATIQELFAIRESITDDGVEVCGARAWPGMGANIYVDAGPVAEIEFLDDGAVRLVGQPANSRATMERSEREQLHVPGSVNVTNFLTSDPTHNDRPVSTKVGQVLVEKKKQCLAGALNVVVIGMLTPWDDHAVEDGLFGVGFAAFGKGPDGLFGPAVWKRKGSGPFTPAEHSEDASLFVDPFRIVSAVWALRLSATNPRSEVLLNPNASIGMPEEDRGALERLGELRATEHAPATG